MEAKIKSLIEKYEKYISDLTWHLEYNSSDTGIEAVIKIRIEDMLNIVNDLKQTIK